jgi:hypothetical protein
VITLTAFLQYRVILDALAGEHHAEWRALVGAGMLTVVLPWGMLLLGMGLYSILLDTTASGVSNIGWSYMVGQVMVFLYGVVEVVRWRPTRAESFAYRLTSARLTLHVCSGIYYFGLFANGRT